MGRCRAPQVDSGAVVLCAEQQLRRAVPAGDDLAGELAAGRAVEAGEAKVSELDVPGGVGGLGEGRERVGRGAGGGGERRLGDSASAPPPQCARAPRRVEQEVPRLQVAVQHLLTRRGVKGRPPPSQAGLRPTLVAANPVGVAEGEAAEGAEQVALDARRVERRRLVAEDLKHRPWRESQRRVSGK